uniref:Uncharacterized protein n=1 Tax=Leersia perrieri TaxID=77586 RepID=A0A0D9WUY6_9ORYZ
MNAKKKKTNYGVANNLNKNPAVDGNGGTSSERRERRRARRRSTFRAIDRSPPSTPTIRDLWALAQPPWPTEGGPACPGRPSARFTGAAARHKVNEQDMEDTYQPLSRSCIQEGQKFLISAQPALFVYVTIIYVNQTYTPSDEDSVAIVLKTAHYCSVCECVVKDLANYLDHVDGKKRNYFESSGFGQVGTSNQTTLHGLNVCQIREHWACLFVLVEHHLNRFRKGWSHLRNRKNKVQILIEKPQYDHVLLIEATRFDSCLFQVIHVIFFFSSNLCL